MGNPFKAVIAFSGSKTVDGIECTEAEMNGFGEGETREYFDRDDYRLLVVANKYLTGFDQPRLTAMYVDKKLQGVLAVQALSRLNRSAPGLGKKTEDLFILDFFNTVDDIKKAFDLFYTATSLSQATDVNVLHELKDTLDEAGVYEWHEVDQFVKLYFSNADAQQLSPFIDTAAARFDAGLALEEEEKADFKIKAKQFVKIYGQMASIMPYEIEIWEKLFWFLKFLNIADRIKAHPDFEEKYKNNQDGQNRELAFEKIFEEVILKNRRNELELYKLLANDAAFKAAMQQSLQRLVEPSL